MKNSDASANTLTKRWQKCVDNEGNFVENLDFIKDVTQDIRKFHYNCKCKDCNCKRQAAFISYHTRKCLSPTEWSQRPVNLVTECWMVSEGWQNHLKICSALTYKLLALAPQTPSPSPTTVHAIFAVVRVGLGQFVSQTIHISPVNPVHTWPVVMFSLTNFINRLRNNVTK